MGSRTITGHELSTDEMGAMPKGTVLAAADFPGGTLRYLLRDESDPVAPWLELPAKATLIPTRFTDAEATYSCGTNTAVVFRPESEMRLAA